jgi:hypothetical protein
MPHIGDRCCALCPVARPSAKLPTCPATERSADWSANSTCSVLIAPGKAALDFFDDNAFRVPAFRALEGPEFESRLTRHNLRKIHLRGAFWAPRTIVHVRECRCVIELWHDVLPLIHRREYYGLSATDAWHEAVADDEKDRAPIVPQ